MLTFMIQAKLYLDAIDIRLWWLLIALAVAGIVQIWRKVHAPSFDAIPSRFKALPAAAIGLVLAATASDDIGKLLLDLLMGAVSGLTAGGGHELVRRLVTGEGQKPPALPADPPSSSS